jgi:bifunctional DNA-binding transcriptional regulator/antitoxin component of YhaV-PrlF toxin-antitoxin module
MINKTLQPTNDMYLQFTEEELQTLNMKPGDKFEVKHHDDGSIELRPYVKIELDMEEWPREVLELIIKQSCEEDISANDVINNLLKESLKLNELKNECGCKDEQVLPTANNGQMTAHVEDILFKG